MFLWPYGHMNHASPELQEFKKAGMTASQARKVLSTWEKAGVKDPETLRKLLMQRHVQIQFHCLNMQLTVFACTLRTIPSVTGPLLQAVVDSVICFGGAIKHPTSFWHAKHSDPQGP